jgi:hypothetical protein
MSEEGQMLKRFLLFIIMIQPLLITGCGFKRWGPIYFDNRCHRDLPRIWRGAACPKTADAAPVSEGEPQIEEEKKDEGEREKPCALAINPALCIRDGIEHSVWRSKEQRAKIALSYDLSLQSYYEFRPDGGYTHYLFFTHPFLPNRFYEKRQGTIQLERNDIFDSMLWTHNLDFQLASSSCSSRAKPSLFAFFDASNRSHIRRENFQVSLLFPDIDMDIEVGSLEELIAHIILNFTELVFEVFFAPLTPNFWKEVITGPLSWDERTGDDLTALLNSSEESCLSEDGIRSMVNKLSIPQEVQLILLSQ